jgi:hypothetical protein
VLPGREGGGGRRPRDEGTSARSVAPTSYCLSSGAGPFFIHRYRGAIGAASEIRISQDKETVRIVVGAVCTGN